MVTRTDSPYQIFKKNELPDPWEVGFQNNLTNWPTELHPQLQAAWESASTQTFPNRKDESWRWMDFKPLDLESLTLNTHGSPLRLTVRHILEDDEPGTERASIPQGVIVTTMRELVATDPDLAVRLLTASPVTSGGIFAELPSALANDGLIVYIPRGVTVEGAVQCYLEVSLDQRAAFTRSLVWLEEGAALNLEVGWFSDPSSECGFHNGSLDVYLGGRSNLHLDERQQFDKNCWNITYETAHLGADSQFNWNYAAVGSNTSKNFIKVELDGKGSQANLQGVMFPSDGQVINLDTRQNHWAERTVSNLLYRSVARQKGRSIWHGMIYVDPKARQTDAYQSNKNLDLDDSADVKSVPGLEILNEDVKCSHGATVGSIDEEEMYYLQARGIPPIEAETLIVEGFFNEVIQSFKLEGTRRELLEQLMTRMSLLGNGDRKK
jgi:Fe-S cluster assembly protein SufD